MEGGLFVNENRGGGKSAERDVGSRRTGSEKIRKKREKPEAGRSGQPILAGLGGRPAEFR